MEATHDDILTEMAVNVDIVKTEASTQPCQAVHEGPQHTIFYHILISKSGGCQNTIT